MAFSSEIIDSSPSPSFASRLSEEKKVNVYMVPGENKFGQKTYTYALASAALHDQFIDALTKFGEIPNFAVIVEYGIGEPTAEIKKKMKDYYGFEDEYYANDNISPAGEAVTG